MSDKETLFEVIKAIHKGGLESDILKYLADWHKNKLEHLTLSNHTMASSLECIRRFNDKKWHKQEIDALTDVDNILRSNKTKWDD